MTELGQTIGGPLYFWGGLLLSVLLAVIATRSASRSDAVLMVAAIPFAGIAMAGGPAFFGYSPLWGEANDVALKGWVATFIVASAVAVLRPRRGALSH